MTAIISKILDAQSFQNNLDTKSFLNYQSQNISPHRYHLTVFIKKNNWSPERQHAFYYNDDFYSNSIPKYSKSKHENSFIMHWKCQHISFKNITKISQENSISENSFGQ